MWKLSCCISTLALIVVIILSWPGFLYKAFYNLASQLRTSLQRKVNSLSLWHIYFGRKFMNLRWFNWSCFYFSCIIGAINWSGYQGIRLLGYLHISCLYFQMDEMSRFAWTFDIPSVNTILICLFVVCIYCRSHIHKLCTK